MSKENIYKDFGELIKWPQCIIVGNKVTIDQAKDILLKCDSFFRCSGSNNRKLDESIWNKLKFPNLYDYDRSKHGDYLSYLKTYDDWVEKYGLLELNYLDTSYISTCFIGGVHGWCHPNGTIYFRDNIGKWPGWDEIHEDCRTIAKAFPYLNMKVYLFNQEADCESFYDYAKECVGGFKIMNGRVYLLKKKEFLDPNDSICSISVDRNKEKSEIFKNPQNLNPGLGLCSHVENFFTEEEFFEYFSIFKNKK